MTAHHERECKLDAASDAVIDAIQDFVLAHPKIYAPAIQRVAPGIPAALRKSFATPLEVTEPRIRLYWDDVDLTMQKNGIEIRQEPRPKGGIKQMVKIGGGQGQTMLDRQEHSANIDHFGIDIDAIKDSNLRRRLKTITHGKTLKPIISMISQRMKMNYHPDGNPGVVIELGLDAPCHGYCFDGFKWQLPQIELELVDGPVDAEQARVILEWEAARLYTRFDLMPNVTSKPAAGFAHLRPFLATPAGRQAFTAHNRKVIWWA